METETNTTDTQEPAGSLDMTPTWSFALQVHLACLLNPDADPAAKNGAQEELERMAKLADQFTEGQRQLQEVMSTISQITESEHFQPIEWLLKLKDLFNQKGGN